MINQLYTHALKPVLFRMDPDFVHNRFVSSGELLGRTAVGRGLMNTLYGYHGQDISLTVDGLTYKTPVLLSAGFDYNGRLTQILPSLGFGGEEIGSITLHPCPGNPKPQLRRAIQSKSIIVYKGLKNQGVDAIIKRLQSRPQRPGFIQGISIARTNNETTSTTKAGIDDYVGSLHKLVEATVGDYYTINISCPNAFGGEDFANPHTLPILLKELKTITHTSPMYVKMPINKPWEEFKPLVKIILDAGFQGVVTGNLNKDYSYLDVRSEGPAEYRGALSGKPCRKLSTALIKQTRTHFGKDITIMGVGGILTAADAIEKFEAGANLVQLITGMIFTGPQLVKEIDQAYAQWRTN